MPRDVSSGMRWVMFPSSGAAVSFLMRGGRGVPSSGEMEELMLVAP